MTQSKSLIAERYRLIESLGAGGMGRVWLARDEMLRRDVAIKEVIPPEGLTPEEREELRLRTMREARAAARLNDPNVVRIYDVVHTEQAPWIVMEYVPSRSLHQVITDDGPLPPERVATIGLAVLSALRAAHGAGVLHRDVKPGNVLLADTGRVVLTDFGLAVFEGGDGAVTRPGLILGSPQYISPERAREGISGPESDMWSLGATLYAAVEGRSPYARSTTYATLTALATEDPDPATRAGVLKPVLNALLRKDPRARAGVAETERLLQRAAAGEGRGWPWVLPRPRRSKEGHPSGLRSPSGGSRGSVGGSRGSGGSAQPVSNGPIVPVSAPPGGGEQVSNPLGTSSDVSPDPVKWNQGPFKDGRGEEQAAPVSPAPAPRIEFPGRARGSAAVPAEIASEGLVTLNSDDDDFDRTIPRNQRWRWIAAGLAALAVAITAVVFLADSGGDKGSKTNSLPTGIQATGEPAVPLEPSAGAASPTPSESPRTEGSIGGDPIELPQGYHYETDQTYGWTVAVPDGWIRTPHPSSKTMVYFVSNTDSRWRMGIDTSFQPPQGDPVADWVTQEKNRLKTGEYPGYLRVKIEAVTGYIGACADWQWTYDSSQGGRLRVSNLGCRVRSNLGHAIYWQVPEDMWSSPPCTTMYGIIKTSFVPKPA
jgi:serine/threonine protein kinase